MKLHFFPKTAQKLVFLRKKEVKLFFYETKINHEKNYETVSGFTKKSEVSPKIVKFQN